MTARIGLGAAVFALGATTLLFGLAGAFAATPARVNPSSYYGGRMAATPGQVATEVRGTWTAPTYSGKCVGPRYAGALFGVQLDLYAGDYVAVGTNLTCDHGVVATTPFYSFGDVYQTGFDRLPVSKFLGMTIGARDRVFGEINETGCTISGDGTGFVNYTVRLVDLTKGASAHASYTFAAESACMLASDAFWGVTTAVWQSGSTQPLAKFSGFTMVRCGATIGGVSGGLHSFQSRETLTLFDQTNTGIEASLAWSSPGRNSFSMIWRNSGP